MPQVELSDRFCQSAKVLEGRKTDYFDTIVKGLCLRVSSGGAKAWFVVYTKPSDGKRAWYKLGTYPEVSLGGDKGARQRARDERARISDGTDPVVEKRSKEAAQGVRDLVENYLKRKVTERKSVQEIARRLRKNISGYDEDGNRVVGRSDGCIGDVKLAELHARDITRAIDAIVDRGAKTEANRVFEDVRAMIRWAKGRGDLDTNLVDGMQKPTEAKARTRSLSLDEIAIMWKALADANMRESTRRIIRLCLITGQRVGEVCGMTRAEISDNRMEWTIPAARLKRGEKHGNHVVPLSEMALRIIREQMADNVALATRKGRPTSSWIFPGPGARAAVRGDAVAKAIKRQEASKRGETTILGIAPWTCHDLRRTAATGMAELGISPFIVSHVLGHVSVTKASVTGEHYDTYDYGKEKREALDLWSDRLEGILSGRSAAIIPLRSASGL